MTSHEDLNTLLPFTFKIGKQYSSLKTGKTSATLLSKDQLSTIIIKVTKIGTGREDMDNPPESEVGNMMIVQLQIG